MRLTSAIASGVMRVASAGGALCRTGGHYQRGPGGRYRGGSGEIYRGGAGRASIERSVTCPEALLRNGDGYAV